jgi:hypothetical protein
MNGIFSKEIEAELTEKGYHVLKKSLAKESKYPNDFPDFGNINTIKIGGIYALRLFFQYELDGIPAIDSGILNVFILSKKGQKYKCNILTQLPGIFPLKQGDELDITKDEILFEAQ